MFIFILILSVQLFFEDSVRNIQSGKRIGLDTVLVIYLTKQNKKQISPRTNNC